MSDHVEKTIADVQQQIRDLEDEVVGKKKTVNALCELIDRHPLYHDVDSPASQNTINNDQFYGKPLATVARQVLEIRTSSMAVADIYEAMKDGGFNFDNKNAANAKRSLRISLSKNTSTFHKLPNGTYGLLEWYPTVKNGGKAKDEVKPADDEAQPDDDHQAVANGFKEEAAKEGDEERQKEAVAQKG